MIRPTQRRSVRVMSSRRAQRPDPAPLETNDGRVVLIGTAGWVIALAVLAVMRLAGVGDVQGSWLVMCVSGIALGLFGVRYCQRRRAAIARDAARGVSQRS